LIGVGFGRGYGSGFGRGSEIGTLMSFLGLVTAARRALFARDGPPAAE
jgi:hypothetical protein